MKLISTNTFLICLLFVLEFSACSSTQQTNSANATTENKTINSPSKTPRIPDNTANISDQNFLKEWKEIYDATLAELERNRKLWQESKIANYDFVMEKGGGGVTNKFNASPVLIKIRNSEKISMESVTKDNAFNTESYTDFDRIDKLFDYIKQELDDRKIIDIKYDKKFGYPKEVSIIFTVASTHGGRFIQISKLEVVK